MKWKKETSKWLNSKYSMDERKTCGDPLRHQGQRFVLWTVMGVGSRRERAEDLTQTHVNDKLNKVNLFLKTHLLWWKLNSTVAPKTENCL
ncbi:hypothetical protein M5K25_021739 [Dendrobium thyrsiflorum]|uniref:Uncharacterized protein n=1 Tax=Dendrobium thyrsiflorum TaxID=117978 RepID=A0ABD0U525_DENTH